jgi:hypothetical protein
MYRRQRRHLYYVVKFQNTICPTQPQLSLHRRAALSSDSNGTLSYIAERTPCAVYFVRCLWLRPPLQTIVFPFKDIGKILCTIKRGEKVCFLNFLDKNNIISSIFLYTIYPVFRIRINLCGSRCGNGCGSGSKSYI